MALVSSAFLFFVGIVILLISVFGVVMNEYWLTAYVCVIGMILVIISALTNIIGNETEVIDSEGRAVLITGCEHGFGFEIARKFNSVGFKVFAGCLNPEENDAVQLRQVSGGRIYVFKLDVTSDESVKKSLEVVNNLLKNHVLWCLIMNTGLAEQSLVEFCPLSSFQRHLEMNALGPIRLTQTFLPLLRRSRGRLVNVVAHGGRISPWCQGAHNASKMAFIGFLDTLRKEMSQFAVNVISVEPCNFKTKFIDPDAAIELNKRYWREADDDRKAFYGEPFYKSVLKLYKKRLVTANVDSTYVIDDVMDAAVSYAPRTRYSPGPVLARTRYWFMQICPFWLQDALSRSNGPDEKVAANLDDT